MKEKDIKERDTFTSWGLLSESLSWSLCKFPMDGDLPGKSLKTWVFLNISTEVWPIYHIACKTHTNDVDSKGAGEMQYIVHGHIFQVII